MRIILGAIILVSLSLTMSLSGQARADLDLPGTEPASPALSPALRVDPAMSEANSTLHDHARRVSAKQRQLALSSMGSHPPAPSLSSVGMARYSDAPGQRAFSTRLQRVTGGSSSAGVQGEDIAPGTIGMIPTVGSASQWWQRPIGSSMREGERSWTQSGTVLPAAKASFPTVNPVHSNVNNGPDTVVGIQSPGSGAHRDLYSLMLRAERNQLSLRDKSALVRRSHAASSAPGTAHGPRQVGRHPR